MKNFRNMDIEERRRDLIELLNVRARRSGTDLPSDVVMLVKDTEDMILKQFPNVTFEEIEKALENGFSGKYSNKVMRSGIYADKIISYIRSYREEMGYYSKTNIHEVRDAEAPSLSSEESIKNYVAYYFQCYIEWKNGSHEPFLKAKLAYDALYHMGLIGLDTPPESYFIRAEDIEKTDRLDKHMRGMINLNFSTRITFSDESVVNIAKKLYLYDYFESLIIQNISIDNLVRDRRVPQKYINMRNYELTH